MAFNYAKSFKNIQETIERDIHRTFPRHSLVYDNKDENEEASAGEDGNDDDDDDDDDDALSVDTDDLQKGICGTTEISSLIRELELAQARTVDTPAVPAAAVPAAAAAAATDGDRIHTGNTSGDRFNQTKILDCAGGQFRLRRVLKAYSTYDREIGYCQGMHFIAAMFLTLVSEEDAFWLLVCASFVRACVCVCVCVRACARVFT